MNPRLPALIRVKNPQGLGRHVTITARGILEFLQLACAKEGAGVQTDRDLVDRFVRNRDQSAFALLV
jgi:hypothetical protein